MIVVTGATGNVGRPLVEALAAAGEDVTAVSRGLSDGAAGAAGRGSDGRAAGVRRLRADLAEPDSLAPARS